MSLGLGLRMFAYYKNTQTSSSALLQTCKMYPDSVCSTGKLENVGYLERTMNSEISNEQSYHNQSHSQGLIRDMKTTRHKGLNC